MKLNIEQRRSLLDEGHKFCFDVAKLIIGGVILAGIMREDIDRYILYGWGVFFVIFLICLGIVFLIMSKNKRK